MAGLHSEIDDGHLLVCEILERIRKKCTRLIGSSSNQLLFEYATTKGFIDCVLDSTKIECSLIVSTTCPAI